MTVVVVVVVVVVVLVVVVVVVLVVVVVVVLVVVVVVVLVVVVCAGVLDDVQTFYNINNKEASLLSTAFIISYMLLSPIFGYLGDRCNRTVIMSCGIISWSVITFASSFVDRQVHWFCLTTYIGGGLVL